MRSHSEVALSHVVMDSYEDWRPDLLRQAMPENEMITAPDPATTDESSENARDGARKRRDSNEPAAVVGLGASAGGVAPLQQFFSDMNPESGLAFVVVMHLSPDFESQLASILQTKTAMPVTQVGEPVKVKPNHVYVIPPNYQLTFEDGMLGLVPPQQSLGRRLAIDLFFRTLAQSYGQRAVCVILSGTDSDGTIGLKHVRAQGGLTVAQDPNEAEYDSMPVTAINTGMVDWVLPVAEMPAKLLEFVKNEHAMRLPPEILDAPEPDAKEKDAPGGETVSDETRAQPDEAAISEVLAHLHAQTGHDFAHYKRATILRRIARRLQVNSIASIPEYLDFMRTHPMETRGLLHDLLIGVTHFFRDRASFGALEALIPQLFAGKSKEDELRVWVAGCATGEEAYSIAMLLCEQASRLEDPPKIQVFATDIDEQSITDARHGIYPATIEADVAPERLGQFFVKEHGHYRMRKAIRDKVLFAAHNILRDAPFSRCDLVSCRNLLIYLNPTAQEQVFDIFHFALRSGGWLFLGGAETEGQGQSRFSSVDPKHRIFVRRSTPRPGWKVPILPLDTASATVRQPGGYRARQLPALTQTGAQEVKTEEPEATQGGQARREVLFGELHLRLLEEYGPPSVIVNEGHEIVHLSPSAGRYLHFSAGEPTANVVKVVHPELQIELRSALSRAAQKRERVKAPPKRVQVEGRSEVLTLEIRPMKATDQAQGFFLVLFEKAIDAPEEKEAAVAPPELVSREADEEIEFLKEQLRATVEQYEAANEELKASNEELETSKEELQSVNEELTTVNQELKGNVEELSRVNADINSLIASGEIGTIFLDRKLSIRRFTPAAQNIFNLIPADMGRPLADITHKLHYEGLIADAKKVLRDLRTIEQELQVGKEQSWYLARLAPYRTSDDRIAGIVATFIDITRRKQAEEEVRAAAARYRTLFEFVPVGVYTTDADGVVLEFNQRAVELWGRTPAAKGGRYCGSFKMFYPDGRPMPHDQCPMARVLRDEELDPADLEVLVEQENGTRRSVLVAPRALKDEQGTIVGAINCVHDISDRKRIEEALRQSEERFRQFAENSADTLWILNAQTRQLEYLSPAYERMWGESRETVMKDMARWVELLHPEDRDRVLPTLDQLIAGESVARSYRIVRPDSGATQWIRDVGFPIRDESGRVIRVAGIAQDITEDQRRAEKLRASEERFRLMVEGARDYAMFLMDPDSKISFWSRGAERVFGWTRGEAIGQTGEMIFTPEDRKKGAVEKEIGIALREGRAPDRRFHLRKDGSRFWADGVLMRVDDASGEVRGFAKVARDASDQRTAEDALRHAKDEMEQRVVERTRDLLATNNELERSMVQRQQLEKELLEISEREKRRIGEDLHDMVCQELTATALFLKTTAKKVAAENPAAAETLEESAQTVNRNVGLTRDLARGLQPADLKGAGLKQALKSLAEQACENTSIKCHFRAARGVRVSDDTIALHLYRVAQEAVKNAVKHADPRNVLITLDRNETHACLTVEDDGKGFSPKRRSKGLGLHIMRYRANALGGELKIEKRKRGGMQILCKIPLKK